MSKPESDLLMTNVKELESLYAEKADNLKEERGTGHATNRLVSALDYMAGTGRKRLIRRLEESRDKSFFYDTKTELAKLACDFALVDGYYTFSDYEACAEAEPRFLQCLDAMQNATPLPDDKDSVPATIYIDTDYTPIAIRKNRGERSTLLLRSSSYIPNVPIGTILGNSYGSYNELPSLGAILSKDEVIETDNPQVCVALVEKPHRIDIARPSVFALDPEFVFGIEYDPTDDITRQGGMLAYTPEIALTSLANIVKRVDEIAESVGV